MRRFLPLIALLAAVLVLIAPVAGVAAPTTDKEDQLEKALYGFGNSVTVSRDADAAIAYLSPGLARQVAKTPKDVGLFQMLGFGSTLPSYYAFAVLSMSTAEAQVKITWTYSNKSTTANQLYWMYTVAGWKIGSLGKPPAPSVVASGLATYSKMTFTGTCLPASQPNVFPPNPVNLYARATFSKFVGKHTAIFNWSQPTGALYAAHLQHVNGSAGASAVLCDTLTLDGPYPGTWTLRLTVDGNLMKTVKLSIPPM